MPLTQLDPATALIVVDLQKGIAAYPTIHPFPEVTERAAALTKAFREKGLPVVLVNVTGTAPGRNEQGRAGGSFPDDFADFLPELGQQPSDIVVTKRTWGAFTGTGLEKTLRDRGVTQVVVCGVATSIGAESTARQAHEAGFNVTLATDAMTDMNAEAHENSVTRIFPRLGETGTAEDVLALLASREAAE
ncbi:isochorismatase family protein [Acidimangrovimonas sediminis]|uniref:isochorismatase family protein n=1 Tax=Acidimangrovimonas sediminis TaxID=2056283 RepID=UPI000C809B42|nr:isochorismatase family protein [Acidimangrovimonas sediminis]